MIPSKLPCSIFRLTEPRVHRAWDSAPAAKGLPRSGQELCKAQEQIPVATRKSWSETADLVGSGLGHEWDVGSIF